MNNVNQFSLQNLTESLKDIKLPHGYLYIADFKVTPELVEPYRSEYYCIGLVEEGNLTLQSNFTTQEIKGPSIIFVEPYTVKNWVLPLEPYRAQSILISNFFLQEKLIESNIITAFSGLSDTGVFMEYLTPDILIQVRASFEIIKANTPPDSFFHTEIVRGAVYTLVNIIGGQFIKNRQQIKSLTKINLRFRKALIEHAIKERDIRFYAELLHIHPKHLGRVVKVETGITAGRWIQNQVVLEAKIHLQNLSLSIAQVAGILNFPDQSTFGKYFKKYAGMNPQKYRQYILETW